MKGSNSSRVALKGKKDVDFNKVKCFSYYKTQNFVSQCPNNKKKKTKPHVVTSMDIE